VHSLRPNSYLSIYTQIKEASAVNASLMVNQMNSWTNFMLDLSLSINSFSLKKQSDKKFNFRSSSYRLKIGSDRRNVQTRHRWSLRRDQPRISLKLIIRWRVWHRFRLLSSWQPFASLTCEQSSEIKKLQQWLSSRQFNFRQAILRLSSTSRWRRNSNLLNSQQSRHSLNSTQMLGANND
jgi:hypothetical protein